MTDAFKQLKSAAQSTIQTQSARQEGWVRTNRKPLMIGAGAVLVIEALILCIIHLL